MKLVTDGSMFAMGKETVATSTGDMVMLPGCVLPGAWMLRS